MSSWTACFGLAAGATSWAARFGLATRATSWAVRFGLAVVAALSNGCSANEPAPVVRIATFNIRVLSTSKIQNVDSIGAGAHPQLVAAAEIVRRVHPDILILNELWHDYASYDPPRVGLEENARRFARAYLARDSKESAFDYPYAYAAPCNTGMPSGYDLDRDGFTATRNDVGDSRYAGDCWGWGPEPGSFSMAILSRYPIEPKQVRTFRTFRWRDLPGHHIPPGFFDDTVLEHFPLSSKSHWDVPVRVGRRTVHVFMSVPTPGIFDGPEDRNGRRNFDEIKFWAHYIEGDSALRDDEGVAGGFGGAAPFVIAGDLNAFAEQDSRYDGRVAIDQLLEHPSLQDSGPWLTSSGGLSGERPGAPGFPERRTIFAGTFTARLDYVLPSVDLEIVAGGVYWPSADEDSSGARLAEQASDHRFVWLDVRLP